MHVPQKNEKGRRREKNKSKSMGDEGDVFKSGTMNA
jgi:hypothetical protein